MGKIVEFFLVEQQNLDVGAATGRDRAVAHGRRVETAEQPGMDGARRNDEQESSVGFDRKSLMDAGGRILARIRQVIDAVLDRGGEAWEWVRRSLRPPERERSQSDGWRRAGRITFCGFLAPSLPPACDPLGVPGRELLRQGPPGVHANLGQVFISGYSQRSAATGSMRVARRAGI